MPNNNPTYVFTHQTMLTALSEYEQEQLAAYPKQKERIGTAVLALQDFFQSAAVINNKMCMSGDPSEVEIMDIDRDKY